MVNITECQAEVSEFMAGIAAYAMAEAVAEAQEYSEDATPAIVKSMMLAIIIDDLSILLAAYVASAAPDVAAIGRKMAIEDAKLRHPAYANRGAGAASAETQAHVDHFFPAPPY